MSEQRNYEINTNPDLYDEQVLTKYIKREYEYRNEAQLINSIEWINKYGKDANRIKPNTKTANLITRKDDYTFGSVADYNIDTVPKGYYHLKGTEITELNMDNKEYRGKQLMNRRFLSNVLREYCYIMGMQYKKYKKRKDREDIGISKYCIRLYDKSSKKEFDLISGVECEYLIHLIIDEMRNRNLRCFNEYRCRINNPELPKYINTQQGKKKISDKYLWLEVAVYQEIKNDKGKIIAYDELNDEQTGLIQKFYRAWLTPKFSWEYLNNLLDEINSGDYWKEIYMPIIYDLFTYPLKNTDTHLKQLTNTDFNKAKSEYESAVFDNLQYDY